MHENKYRFETLQLHVGQETPDAATNARAVPIYQTTSFVFHDTQHAADLFALKTPGNIYTRLMNPTWDVLEKRIAALEGGVAALATASGAAAINYVCQALAHQGDHIVAETTIYGGTYNLLSHTLPNYGVTTTFVDARQGASAFEAAILENTKAILIETIGNPNADLVDIEAIAAVAHRHGIPLIVDNTFATPYLLRPIEHGADIVVHSATKFIGGHGTTLGGIIVDAGNFDWTASGRFPHLVEPNASYHGLSFAKDVGRTALAVYIRALLLRDTGASLSPFDAFLLLQGVETLSLRVERHTQNALKVVDFLQAHPAVETINHPSLSTHPDHALYQKYFPHGGISIFTFALHGGSAEARRFIDALDLFSQLANVADVKSLVIHPASTTHAQMNEATLKSAGITPATIRLSIGCEHIDDIIDDLKKGFAAIG